MIQRVSRRVVVTGAGVVASIGTGVQAFWDALARGASGATTVEVEGVPPAVAFAVPELDAEERFGRREARRMDRDGQLAGVAALLALEEAGELGLPAARVGVAVGNAHGGMATMDAAYRALHERGPDRVSPFAVPLALPNAPAATVARVLGLHGPSSAVSTACAAGSDAIGLAFLAIRDGRADAMLAGGAEAPLSAFTFAGYGQLGALAKGDGAPEERSRPFDRARNGFVMGEGAGILVLEERDHALQRGATVLAEVAGYGATCDAGHLTDPDPTGEGPAGAIAAALADAGLTAADIGYVNAHATSTPVGDAAEARTLVRAGLGGVPVSSTKGSHGHCLGAAGGIEAVATLMALVQDRLPPGINLVAPDEDDPGLDHVAGTARPARVDAVLSNSFGFGGHNAALVFRRHAA
jgi:3-oxoacyl-[acyl-carrier-protein] synthase II